jgi:hypothetical protein
MFDEGQVRDFRAENGVLAVASLLGKQAQSVGREVRRRIMEDDHPDLSIGQQCALLSIPRSSFFNAPQR